MREFGKINLEKEKIRRGRTFANENSDNEPNFQESLTMLHIIALFSILLFLSSTALACSFSLFLSFSHFLSYQTALAFRPSSPSLSPSSQQPPPASLPFDNGGNRNGGRSSIDGSDHSGTGNQNPGVQGNSDGLNGNQREFGSQVQASGGGTGGGLDTGNGRGSQSPSSSIIGNKDLLTYSNNALGIKLQYPSDWSYSENKGSVIFKPSLSNVQVQLHISSIHLADRFNGNTVANLSLEDAAKVIIKQFQGNDPSFKLLSVIPNHIPNTSILIRMNWLQDGNSIDDTAAILRSNNQTFLLADYTASSDQYDQFITPALDIIQSIRFISSNNAGSGNVV
jgi:hypothetical protein